MEMGEEEKGDGRNNKVQLGAENSLHGSSPP